LEVLPEIDGQGLRCEVLSNTSLLARLSRSDEQRLSQPLFPARPARVWYARHASYSSFDPLEIALGLLAQPEGRDRLPANASELEGYAAVVIVAPRPGVAPFTPQAMSALIAGAGATVPVLLLTPTTPATETGLIGTASNVAQAHYPITIARLAAWIETLGAPLAAAA
jgi:hypothetical protein